jgi:membrane-associated phospholipid phosphatase
MKLILQVLNKKLISVVFFFFGFISILYSQADSLIANRNNCKLNGRYFLSYICDTKDVLISPIKWNAKEWLSAGGIIGATTLLYTQDKSLKDFFQSNRNTFTNNISTQVFERVGSGVYSLPILGVAFLYGTLTKKEKPTKVALDGVKAFVISGILVQGIKIVTQRQRPYQDPQPSFPDNFDGLQGNSGYNSFPSGHTTSAFSIATVIATEYKDVKWVPYVCYSIAGLTGLSRINDNKHWASDVLMGAAIGFGVGKLIAKQECWNSKFFKKKKKK